MQREGNSNILKASAASERRQIIYSPEEHSLSGCVGHTVHEVSQSKNCNEYSELHWALQTTNICTSVQKYQQHIRQLNSGALKNQKQEVFSSHFSNTLCKRYQWSYRKHSDLQHQSTKEQKVENINYLKFPLALQVPWMEFVVEKVKYHQAQTIYPSTPKSCLSTLGSLPGPVKYDKN